MDISDKYIKMCEKAEEIQNIRPLGTDGSWFYYPDKDVVRCRNSYEGEFGEVWLPRQDQLQEIVVSESKNWEGVFGDFLYFYQDVDMRNIKSMEQLWLAFVMKEKYNKVWDDNKEEWRKNEKKS